MADRRRPPVTGRAGPSRPGRAVYAPSPPTAGRRTPPPRAGTARLCCVLAILAPLTPARSAVAPYTALAWTAPARPLPHVVGTVRYQAGSDPDRVAAALAARPAGRRALLRWESNDNHVWRNPADLLPGGFAGPWIDHGAAAEAAFEARFAAALKQRGATPDFLVLDTEMGIVTPTLAAKQLAAIVADPRWPPLARRFNIGRGGDLVGRTDTANDRAFNLAMQETTGGFLRAAFYEPWLKRFPDLTGSDFGDGLLDERQAADAPDDGGVVQPMGPPMHGDTQSPYCYGWVHGIGRPPADRGADFARPLPVLCWLSDTVRAYARTPRPVLPWVAAKSWTDASPKRPAGTVAIRGTPFEDELLWHLCLGGGCTSVLYFNPDGRPADDAAMDADLAELQRQTGDAPSLRPLTTDAVPFTADVLVSGAVTPAGRRVYRVTVGEVGPRRGDGDAAGLGGGGGGRGG